MNYQDTFLGSEREPDYWGEGGSVWVAQLRTLRERVDQTPTDIVGMWFFSVEDSPAYYMTVLQHLRPKPGYQVQIFRLLPEYPVPILDMVERFDGTQGAQIFTADTSVVAGIVEGVPNDAQAHGLVDDVMHAIVRGLEYADVPHDVQWAHILTTQTLEFVSRLDA